MKNVEQSVCAQCHLQNTGCCTLATGDEKEMFGLTRNEIISISNACGLKPERYVVQDTISHEFKQKLRLINPIFLKTMPHNTRLRLKITPKGKCFFLGEQGCRLPQKARPLYCRLYPFWFTSDQRLMVLISPTCLAQRNATSWQEVLRRLNEDEANLTTLFQKFCENANSHYNWFVSENNLTDIA